jgi:hypothetical protein
MTGKSALDLAVCWLAAEKTGGRSLRGEMLGIVRDCNTIP